MWDGIGHKGVAWGGGREGKVLMAREESWGLTGVELLQERIGGNHFREVCRE